MSDEIGFWAEMEEPGPESAHVGGVEIRAGSRVRLHLRGGGEVLDLALGGRVGVVEAIDEDHDGNVHVAVTLEDDPGRDLGQARFPGHRFFFSAEEIEPLGAVPATGPAPARVLVAGIGNIFLGDDGFGVAVAAELNERRLPAGVEVVDFGIRGMDLAFALQAGYRAVIFVDAAQRGEHAGTLSVVEHDAADEGPVVPDGHGMDPLRVLALARSLGVVPERTLVVACEPVVLVDGAADDDLVGELSPPVRAAVASAADLVESLLPELLHTDHRRASP